MKIGDGSPIGDTWPQDLQQTFVEAQRRGTCFRLGRSDAGGASTGAFTSGQQTPSSAINGGMHFRSDCYPRPFFAAARTEQAREFLLRYVGR